MSSPDIDEIARNQAINPDWILNGFYFLYEVTKQDSLSHAGEIYALPSIMNLPGRQEDYFLENSGALVSEKAVVSEDSVLGGRVIVSGESTIEEASVIGNGTILDTAEVIGATAGKNSFIDKFTHIYRGARIGKNSMLAQYVDVEQGVYVGPNACIDNNVRIGANAVVGRNVLLLSGLEVAGGERIGPWQQVSAVGSERSLGRITIDSVFAVHRYMLYNEPTGFNVKDKLQSAKNSLRNKIKGESIVIEQ